MELILPQKPPELFAREHEWTALSRSFSRPRPELVFVVGRRRVGKSFFLTRFAQAVGGIYYQATRRTEEEQLAHLSQRLGVHFEDQALLEGATLPSWEALFRYLTERLDAKPLLLVLDEFPYLAAAAPALTSIIQRFWDHDWQRTRLRLVLCGSFITAMTRLEGVDQPLYGRRTAKLSFQPFAATNVGAFVPRWQAADKLLLYGVVGNLPGHLALVDPAVSLAQNVEELLLGADGRLVDDAQNMLDAFSSDAAVPYSIIEAIATGAKTWSGITTRVGKSGGAILRPLRWLEEMQLVERRTPISERDPARSKRALYRITDPYLEFWHKFIAPLVRAGGIGLAGPAHLWASQVRPRLDDHMGSIFEQVCRDYVASGRGVRFEPIRVGAWWTPNNAEEIDVVAMSSRNEMFVGECKWGKVTAQHLRKLRARAQLLAREMPTTGAMQLTLFSGRGEADAEVRAAAANGDITLVGPDDLMA